MRKPSFTLLAAVLAGSALGAQDVKVNACINIYWTQMLDNNLRLDTPTGTLAAGTGSGSYYPLRSDFRENGLSLRRAEVYLNGKITDEVTFNLMFDPNTTTSTSGAAPGATTFPTLVFDAILLWKPNPKFEFKLGQFKPPTSYEATLVGSPALYFYDRSMMNRQIGDRRDRGFTASYLFGKPKEFGAKLTAGFFNGSADRDFGRGNDANAQKDFAFRLEMNYGADHKFGFYSKQGVTDQADKGGLTVGTFAGASNDAGFKQSVIDNKDKTTATGAYYVYETSKWHASAELMTGLLGRRWASIGVATAVRQHLDQKFLGYTLTGVYKMGKHQFTGRYDFMNYNKGDDWYTSYNPYTQTSAGASLGADYSPKYTEVVLGYNYLLNPGKYSYGQVKLNYIHRSKNFLLPRAGQSGEQGGDSLVAVFQIGF